jgi:thymidylate kinase
MPIIYFFGPDGSGKTSLVRKTALALSTRGHRVKISWMRGTHTISFMFSRILRVHAAFKGCNQRMISIPNSLKPVWRLIEFVSVMPVLLIRFVVPSLLGFWVIGERYIPDFIVWVSIVTNDNDYVNSLESKILLSLARKAVVNIYVTADIIELNARSSENFGFLTSQLRLYGVLAKELNAYTVNTTHRSVESSFQEVNSIISQKRAL